jgi:hypothetical protein
MKNLLSLMAAGLMALSAVSGLAQTATLAIGTLQVKDINVVEIDATHVKAAVDLTLIPSQSATLADLRLVSLRLNGLPVFAEPLNQEIALKKGVTTALPPIYVTLLFRDVTTVAPVSQMIEKQSVHVEGEMVAAIRLNFIEKLAIGSMHPKVAITLEQNVPAKIPGNEMQQKLALTVLSGVDIGLETKAKLQKIIPGARPAWIGAIEAQGQPNLFVVETSFAVKQDGKSFPVKINELGFQLGPRKVLTTAEMRAPWKYDPEFLAAVNAGNEKVEKKSVEMELWPLSQSSEPLRMGAKDFAVEMRGSADKDKVTSVNGGFDQVGVLRRATPDALAVLYLRVPAAQPGLMPAPAAIAAQQSWDQVVVFRLRTDKIDQKVVVEALPMAAHREGQGIKFSEPVDSAVFGSPIVTPDGVIGMVQDENAGTFLPDQMYTPGPQMK